MIYVGQTNNMKHRLAVHLFNAKNNPTSIVDRAIAKYGIENFTIEIIEYVDNQFSDDAEAFWIAYLNTLAPNGYNIKPGGNTTRGHHLSDEHKQKLSEAGKGRIVSEETKKKQSEALMGHIISDDTKRKISQAHIGKTISEETREKMSKAHSGENSPFFGKPKEEHLWYGKKHTEESKKKMSEAQKHRIRSEEEIQQRSERMIEYNKNRVISDETRTKLSEAHRGENHPGAKLTEQMVISIRNDPRKAKEISKEYGIDQSSVYDIKNRRSWKHIK